MWEDLDPIPYVLKLPFFVTPGGHWGLLQVHQHSGTISAGCMRCEAGASGRPTDQAAGGTISAI